MNRRTTLPSSIYCRARATRGFTLVELLAVIGIIVLLLGIGVPMILRAQRTGRQARARAGDMQAIEMALDAYRQDFGNYPGFSPSILSKTWDIYPDRGACLLCEALIGPCDHGVDGADGPGFRTRAFYDSTGTEQYQGRVYGPYLAPDKFKVSYGSAGPGTYDTSAKILDANGYPILYFAGGSYNVVNSNYTQTGGYVAGTTYNPGPPVPFYNGFDNSRVENSGNTDPIKPLLPLADFQTIMSANSSGSLAGTPTYTGPYVLWMAGPDNSPTSGPTDPSVSYGMINASNPTSTATYSIYGIDPNTGKTSAVTNFDMPLQYKR